MNDEPLEAKVLTVSDGVVHGTREDASGAALVQQLTDAGWTVVEHRVTADGVENVANSLREMCGGFAGLIVSTGGTGFAPRDQTPEGTREVIEREAPGWRRRCGWSARSAGCRGGSRRSGASDHLQHARVAEGLCRAARCDSRHRPSRGASAERITDSALSVAG
jgi:molybdenum cofactor synthesis domain-containing protein